MNPMSSGLLKVMSRKSVATAIVRIMMIIGVCWGMVSWRSVGSNDVEIA